MRTSKYMMRRITVNDQGGEHMDDGGQLGNLGSGLHNHEPGV